MSINATPLEQNFAIDLNHLGVLSISGEGAARFLQGQLTCNMDEVSATQSRLGAHCTPQGRVISFFRIFYYNNQYVMMMPVELIPLAREALQKYAVFFKAKVEDKSGEWTCRSYSGVEIRRQLMGLFSDLPENMDEVVTLPDGRGSVIGSASATGSVSAIGSASATGSVDATGSVNAFIVKLPGYFAHYVVLKASHNTDLDTSLTPAAHPIHLTDEVQTGDIQTWKALCIAAGIPTIYAETSGKFLPHEINLPQINSVSFTKGCYTGQEIIARMQYRGHLKKHTYRVEVTTLLQPKPGDDIYHFNGKPSGTIVDSCQTDKNKWQLLVIANEADVESKQLFIDSSKKERLVPLALPYEIINGELS